MPAGIRQRVRASRAFRYLPVMVTLVLVIGGTWMVTRSVELGRLWVMARDADPGLVAAAVAVYLGSWPVRGRRYADILRPMGHRCGTGFMTAALFLSQTANLALPARAGDGVRAYLIKEHDGVGYAEGIASLAVERAFDLVVIGGLAAVATGGLWVIDPGSTGTGQLGVSTGIVVAGSGGMLALGGLTMVIARTDRRLGTALRQRVAASGASRFMAGAISVGGGMRRVAADPRAVATVGASSLVAWLLDVVTTVLILVALGGPSLIGRGPGRFLLVTVLAVSLGNLAKSLPVTQGGIGLYEGAFAGVLIAGAPVSMGWAALVAVLDHTLKNGVTVVGGALSAVLVGVTPTMLRDPTDIEEEDAVTAGTGETANFLGRPKG